MKRSVLALSILAGSLLSGCSTLNGANDAVMNLVGPSTQSRVAGKYVENADVRQHYKLDVQQQSKQRLSYDGHAIPAHETRQNNLVDIPMLQNYLQGIVTRLSKGWPGENGDVFRGLGHFSHEKSPANLPKRAHIQCIRASGRTGRL